MRPHPVGRHEHDRGAKDADKSFYFSDKGDVFSTNQTMDKLKPATKEDFEKQNTERTDKFYSSDAYLKSTRTKALTRLFNDPDLEQSHADKRKAVKQAVKTAGKDVVNANIYDEAMKLLSAAEVTPSRT